MSEKILKLLKYIFIILVIAFILAPIFSMIIFSFNSSKSLTSFTGFSFKWYQKLFAQGQLRTAVLNSIFVALISTLVSTVIGTFAAISLTKTKRNFRKIVLSTNNIPIINPEIVTAIALLIFFGALMIQRGMTTMILAHIAFSTPYVVIAVYPKVNSLDPNLADAAYDLGASPMQTIFKVILPQIKGAILAGAAIAFTMSFDDFAISYFAASGSSVQNISIYLYTLRQGIEPTINALSTIIVVIIVIKIVFDVINNKNRREEE